MFGQTFQPHDILVIGLLIVLEGALSIDNALVLGLLARRLPEALQRKALTYGLIGAFFFRLIAVAGATWLLEWRIVKLLGGGYLLYVAIKHLFFSGKTEHERVATDHRGMPVAVDDHTGKPLTDEELGEQMFRQTHGVGVEYAYARSTHTMAFWKTVGAIELTDVAFAMDSILAAVALVGEAPKGTPPGAMHPKLWVVVTGGMLGVILMRFAAVAFIRLLEKFPRFNTSAYLLVIVIGLKLIADWFFSASGMALNFHDPGSLAFWVFWLLMAVCFAIGFVPKGDGSSVH